MPGQPVQDLDWLVTDFVERVQHVAHALIVSSDGVPMAVSDDFLKQHADQLGAVTAGLTSLTDGAARVFNGGIVIQTAVEMQAGVLVIMSISSGASLAALAGSSSDLELVVYEMTLLVERAGRMITPPSRMVNRVPVLGET